MPKVFMNPARFARACGSPPLFSGPDPQWIKGPIYVQGTLANATALNVDLTQRGTWYGDKRVKTAYSVTSTSDTNRMEAVLQIWGVKILLATQSTTVNTLAALAKLLASATVGTQTSPYLNLNVGGLVSAVPLWEHFAAGADQFQITQTAAADGSFGIARIQSRFRLPTPIRANLKSDAISFVTDAAPALGADVLTQFVLYGSLTPVQAWQASQASYLAGAAGCKGDQDLGTPVDAEVIAAMDRGETVPVAAGASAAF